MSRSGRQAAAPLEEDSAPVRRCDHPGCAEAGLFRAPRDRTLKEFHWFCLPHVRAYNASWDYYKGMGPNEIEQALRADSAWQRPSWPLGRLGGASRFDPDLLRDPFSVLGQEAPTARRRGKEATDTTPPELRAALDLLGLTWPLDQTELRARYKDLAKRHHPDATGGDRQAEEKLKDINRAYSLLKRRVPNHRPAPAQAETAAAG
ncbi:J domain-containing protein [Roseomonas sp. HJA6]|uniref:J domain-containing protein n=1 Tax=Roseomonas alba TaxID=2846776 RepID=A0ABS7AE21_9PROT|nr:J domain-containing protein [Neoroseomonas alba]MBW6400552.1 J domain-containing protein [Neoroseomonas alba]